MLAKLRAFGAFWYDFVIGDDWRVALGVIAGLALTYALARSTPSVWWILPIAVVLLLPMSLWRATRRT